TGIHPRTLKIDSGAEFYLCTEFRELLQLKSFEMTSRKSVQVTIEYNNRLQAAAAKSGKSLIEKHPRALLEKLGKIEPKITKCITDKNYKCA
ncbi:hypothetical protein DFH07DRAFT_744655, partial [Mycena maculata]